MPIDTGLTDMLSADLQNVSITHTSVGLSGGGDRYTDFSWGIFLGEEQTRGALNHGQTLGHVQHAFFDPDPEPAPAPQPDLPTIITNHSTTPSPSPSLPAPTPEPQPSIVVAGPEPEPMPEPLPGPLPEPLPGPEPEPLGSLPEPEPEPQPVHVVPAPEPDQLPVWKQPDVLDPTNTCNTAPSVREAGERDRRPDLHRLRLGTFNLGGLFDGVNDETGVWMGGTNCPGYHTSLNECDAAGSMQHIARLQEVLLRLDVDILNVNEVEDW